MKELYNSLNLRKEHNPKHPSSVSEVVRRSRMVKPSSVGATPVSWTWSPEKKKKRRNPACELLMFRKVSLLGWWSRQDHVLTGSGHLFWAVRYGKRLENKLFMSRFNLTPNRWRHKWRKSTSGANVLKRFHHWGVLWETRGGGAMFVRIESLNLRFWVNQNTSS